MAHFMIVLTPYINILNLSWIKKKMSFLRNMECLNTFIGKPGSVTIIELPIRSTGYKRKRQQAMTGSAYLTKQEKQSNLQSQRLTARAKENLV